MIPVSQDEKIVYNDEKSGVRYFFKTLTGSNEHEYLDLIECLNRDSDKKTQREILDKAFNFMVIGWEGSNLPVFPTDNNPSRFFKIRQKDFLFAKAIELNNLTDEEIKN